MAKINFWGNTNELERMILNCGFECILIGFMLELMKLFRDLLKILINNN